MRRKLLITAIVASSVLHLVAASASFASVQTFGFTNITNNGGPNVASQLFVDVWDANGALTGLPAFYGTGVPSSLNIAPDHVLFVFRNTAAIASIITQVYFDDGTLLNPSTPRVWDTDDNTNLRGNVDFTQGAGGPGPGVLPGGASLPIPFVVTAGFLAKADAPPPMRGINDGSDLLGLSFQLINGQTWSDTIAAFSLGGNVGGLRIGLHVQGLPGGQSDSFINTIPDLPPPLGGTVPEPISVAVWSLILGLASVFTARARQ